MAIREGLFDSTTITTSPSGYPQGDKAETADFFADIIYRILGNGVSLVPTSAMSVITNTGMTVTVKAGVAFKRGYKAQLESDLNITFTTSASERIFYIGVRLDEANGEFTGNNVVARPAFVAETDLAFAKITIPANAVVITDEMIEDLRYNTTYCGFVDTYRQSLLDIYDDFVDALATAVAGGIPAHATSHASGGADAISPESIGAVGYLSAQSLTDAQKEYARDNIGAQPVFDNMLINPDFRNPSNLLALTSGSAHSTAGYFLDDWKLVTGSVTWTLGSGLAMDASAAILQYMEIDYALLLGQTVTISCNIGGTIYSGSGTFPASVPGATVYTDISVAGIGTVRIGFEYRSGGAEIWGATRYYVPYLQITAGSAITIGMAKLERGSSASLRTSDYADFAVQSLLCRRYFQLAGGSALIAILGNTLVSIFCPLPIEMRADSASVTLRVSSLTIYDSADKTFGNLSYTGGSIKKNAISYANLSGTITSGSNFTASILKCNTTSIFLLNSAL